MEVRNGAIALAALIGLIFTTLIGFSLYVTTGISRTMDSGEPERAHGVGSGLTTGEHVLVGAVVVGGTALLLAAGVLGRRANRAARSSG